MRIRIALRAVCVPSKVFMPAAVALFAFAASNLAPLGSPRVARAESAPADPPAAAAAAAAAIAPADPAAPAVDALVVIAAAEPAAPPAESAPERAVPEPSAPAAAPDLGAALANTEFDARTRLELEILQRVNTIRAERGLAPLQLDDRLVAAARQHAVDMAYRNFCRHTGSDGSRARDRLRRNGYPFNNWAGENILCARRSADVALKWWMNSAPHRANILHGHFTHIGVGVSMLGTYGPDMVLTFAAGAEETAEPGAFAALRGGNVAGWIAETREPDQRPR